MERPTVLLALEGDNRPFVEALHLAGFDVLTDETAITERLADGLPLDLAVLDCDVASAADLDAALNGVPPAPPLLIFGTEPPSYATESNSRATRDEYALKPVPAEAVVYRLQAL